MDEHFEGDIKFIKGNAMMFVNAVICKSKKFCKSAELLVDTGATRSMISLELGNHIGFDAPRSYEKRFYGVDAQGQKFGYILRDITMYFGRNIKVSMKIPWCISVKIKESFLGMDFFNKFKLVVVGGKTNKFYITKLKNCVFCKDKK